jgi:hypothetical protein
MRTQPDMLPTPNGDLNLNGYFHKPKAWGIFVRTKAPDFDALRLHAPHEYLGRDEAVALRHRKPEFVMVPQRTANEMFPGEAGCADVALKIWATKYELDCCEMPQADALKAMRSPSAFEGNVVFTTAISGEQFATYGFIMTWKDFDMLREIQRTAVT